MEAIEVRYKYLGSIEGHPYYHKYLVYTTDTAVEAARGGPSVDGGTIEVSQAESGLAAHSPFGEIIVQIGAYDEEFIDFESTPDPSEVLAIGSDLSSQWNDIVTAMNAIADNHWAYLPLSQNSNSIADYAIASAGLPAPALDQQGNYWAPGSAHPFTVPYEPEVLPVLPYPVASIMQPAFAGAVSASSPLVIDLSTAHSGVTLTEWNAATTSTFFDLNESGFAVQTAWVTGDTGLLARDLNANGRIDSTAELFGSPTVDGFAKLAVLDSNHDMRIDANDEAWSTLVVWTDTNGDAVTQEGELHSLASLGIANIDLAGVAASTSTISGNPISHTSTVTFTGGATATIADAWFMHDNTNSYYTDSYTLDPEVLFLPTLRGYGTLPDLSIAMSQDSDLKDMVADFVSNFTLADIATADAAITDILYKWAGIENVDPEGRGRYIDGQHLAFLEHFLGTDFVQAATHSANPLATAAAELEGAYQTAFTMLSADILIQAGGAALFDGSASYDPYSGEITGDAALSEDGIGILAAAAPDPVDPVANFTFWEDVARLIDTVKGIENVTTTEEGWLNAAIHLNGASFNWNVVTAALDYNEDITDTTGDGSDNIMVGSAGNDNLLGMDGNDTIYGNDGNDSLAGGNGADTLDGGDGNDVLNGDGGNDVLDGGAGGNTLNGGQGDDTFLYSGGDDVITDTGGNDSIILPAGITLADFSFKRVSTDNSTSAFNDLLILIDGSGTIQIQNHFSSSSSQHVESIVFADQSTVALSSIVNAEIFLTEASDSFGTNAIGDFVVRGLDGDDTILLGGNGNHTLDGGTGNDRLLGGSGDDTYIASPGFDSISNDTNGNDTIVMPEGFDLGDLTFYRINNSSGPTDDLGISIEGLGEIAITSFFARTNYAIENIHFLSDDSTVSLTDRTITTLGTAGNDSLYAPSYNASPDDIMDGREGDDVMHGGAGNDKYIFSAGHDEIVESGTGDDSIIVRSLYTSSDVSIAFVWNSTDDTSLQLTDIDGNTLLVYRHGYSTSYAVEHVVFSDTTWDLSSMEIETHGTEANDTLHGHTMGDASSDDTIRGFGGDDTLYGEEGHDLLFGGDGNDTLYGAQGNDILHGDDGNDLLKGRYDDVLFGDAGDDQLQNNASSGDALSTNVTMFGGAGEDTLSGGYGHTSMNGGAGADTLTGSSNGVDTFTFDAATAFDAVDTVKSFNKNGASHDVIDITDILDGHYDPVSDAITDFVQFSTNGSNTEVYVDPTGAADFSAAAHIATIQNVTGLEDEAALVSSGLLLAA